MNNKTLIILLSSIVLIVVFIIVISYGSRGGESLTESVGCIDPDLPLRQHVHTQLLIMVNGDEEMIPSDIGLSRDCSFVLHTHDAGGEIHVEANDRGEYSLGMFFDVWNREMIRPGYDLRVVMNDSSYEGDPRDIVLEDNKTIVLQYTSSSN